MMEPRAVTAEGLRDAVEGLERERARQKGKQTRAPREMWPGPGVWKGHGEGLVPWLRLRRFKSGSGYGCTLGNGWWLSLYPARGPELEKARKECRSPRWELWFGKPGDRGEPFCWMNPERGKRWQLEGQFGMSRVVGFRAGPEWPWGWDLYFRVPGVGGND